MRAMNRIVLTTLNARYIHAAFGLRYLQANLGDLQAHSIIKEFTIHETALNVAEQILMEQPQIIGISVYIWNVHEVTQLVGVLKQVSPGTTIVLGGPEVSHPPDVPRSVLWQITSSQGRASSASGSYVNWFWRVRSP